MRAFLGPCPHPSPRVWPHSLHSSSPLPYPVPAATFTPAFPPCQLALLHTPPLSDIFVFTDASPKDAFLTPRVGALAQERRCRVSTAGGQQDVSSPGSQETPGPRHTGGPSSVAWRGSLDNEFDFS